MRWLLACLLGSVLVPSDPSSACKYTVRDVAFCDLENSRYRLTLLLDSSRLVDGRDGWDRLSARVRTELRRTNLQARLVDLADPTVVDVLDVERTVVPDLQAALDRATAVLIGPDGRARAITLADDSGTLEDQQVLDALGGLVDSELRRRILDQALASHSLILVVPGSDAEENRTAEQIADRAIAEIERQRPFFPKPIDGPARKIVLRAEDVSREATALWSLGVDPEAGRAQIVALMGRGRKIGQVLQVEEQIEGELIKYLSLVAQDCECGLDRSWMQGVMIPHRWSREDEALALAALGFDPGNPLVQAEMRLILSRGPNYRGPSAAGVAARPDPLDDLLSGYNEFSLDETPIEPDVEPEPIDSSSEPASDESVVNPDDADLPDQLAEDKSVLKGSEPDVGSESLEEQIMSLTSEKSEAPNNLRSDDEATVNPMLGVGLVGGVLAALALVGGTVIVLLRRGE